jgi:O-antigen/teichoic acid export membrane protein
MARSVSRPAAARIASVAVSAKLALMVLATVLLAAFSLTRPGPAQLPTFVVGVALICVSLVETLGHVFRGLQRTRYEAGLVLVQRLITFALGAVAIVRGYGVLGLGIAYLAGGCLTAVLGLLWLRRRFFALRLVVAPLAWWGLLRPALPLGGAIVLSVLYTRTAVLLLEALQDAEAVGLFGVAQKLTEPMAMVPAAVMAAVFPAYSQALVRNGEQSGWLSRWSVGLLALAGSGLASIGVLAGPWLIEQLYGEPYRGSSLPLQVLSLALVLTFVNYALTHFLVASGRQVLNLLFSAILLCANAVLCVVLIPSHGPAGAAAAVVACELLLLILCCSALYANGRTS